MKDFDLLLEEGDKLSFSFLDKQYSVGKLGTIQLIELIKIIGKVAKNNVNKIEKLQDNASKANDIEVLLSMLDVNTLAEFIGIIIKEPDNAISAQVADDPALFSEIILALTEKNNFGKIMSNFQKAITKVTGKL